MFEALCVVNRRNIVVEKMFGGHPIIFQPGEKKHLPPNVAYGIVRDCALQIDIATGLQSAYELGIEGETDCTPLEGALAEENPVEVLDRTHADTYTGHEPKALVGGEAHSLGLGKTQEPGKIVAKITGVQEPIQNQSAGGGAIGTKEL